MTLCAIFCVTCTVAYGGVGRCFCVGGASLTFNYIHCNDVIRALNLPLARPEFESEASLHSVAKISVLI